MHDALHVAEHQRRDHRPAAPQQQRRPGRIGAGGTPDQPQPRRQPDQRGRQQPEDLGAHRIAEQPGQPGIAAEHAAAGTARSRPGAVSGVALTAEHPAQAVVPERQLQQAVVGGPADVRAGIGRPQVDQRDVPAGRGDHRGQPG